jgi:hypothetical protein
MKKERLKREIGLIRPREELITSTIAKVNLEKAKKEDRKAIFSPSFNKGVRLAGAFCAFVLVFCVGFAVAKQNTPEFVAPAPDVKLIGLETEGLDAESIASLDLAESFENGWILISGQTDSLKFFELTQDEKECGALRGCNAEITATGLLDRSESLSVDIDEISATISASAVFYDHDILESFLDMSCSEMILRLTPDGEGGWMIVDFAPMTSGEN